MNDPLIFLLKRTNKMRNIDEMAKVIVLLKRINNLTQEEMVFMNDTVNKQIRENMLRGAQYEGH